MLRIFLQEELAEIKGAIHADIQDLRNDVSKFQSTVTKNLNSVGQGLANLTTVSNSLNGSIELLIKAVADVATRVDALKQPLPTDLRDLPAAQEEQYRQLHKELGSITSVLQRMAPLLPDKTVLPAIKESLLTVLDYIKRQPLPQRQSPAPTGLQRDLEALEATVGALHMGNTGKSQVVEVGMATVPATASSTAAVPAATPTAPTFTKASQQPTQRFDTKNKLKPEALKDLQPIPDRKKVGSKGAQLEDATTWKQWSDIAKMCFEVAGCHYALFYKPPAADHPSMPYWHQMNSIAYQALVKAAPESFKVRLLHFAEDNGKARKAWLALEDYYFKKGPMYDLALADKLRDFEPTPGENMESFLARANDLYEQYGRLDVTVRDSEFTRGIVNGLCQFDPSWTTAFSRFMDKMGRDTATWTWERAQELLLDEDSTRSLSLCDNTRTPPLGSYVPRKAVAKAVAPAAQAEEEPTAQPAQVASTQAPQWRKPRPQGQRCYACGQLGHIKWECPNVRQGALVNQEAPQQGIPALAPLPNVPMTDPGHPGPVHHYGPVNPPQQQLPTTPLPATNSLPPLLPNPSGAPSTTAPATTTTSAPPTVAAGIQRL
jgi:hypothetical protein